MAEPVVLNKANPLSPAEDFNFLRLEGIKHIEKLSGNIWTDYNTHDPGITLLEALCYAITDLAYRTRFNMKDLVAPAKLSADSWKHIFYTARQILPCNPVTLNDYRKMLIDIVGVRNAWITISEDYEVPLYIDYDEAKKMIEPWEQYWSDNTKPKPETELCEGTHAVKTKLGFEPKGEKSKIIELNGLYKIIIEFEEDIIEKKEKEKIRQKALRKLHSHRSLCEDYLSVTGAEYKDFLLTTEVVLKEDADADMVLAQICFTTQNYFTPNHKFYSLEELLEKGYYAEDIFEGPFLQHGFILDKELEKTDFFRDMRLSDIINDVADIEGIIALDTFKVHDALEVPDDKDDPCSNEQYFDEWIAGMKNEKLIGRLNINDIIDKENAVDREATSVKFFKSGNRVTINTDRFNKLLKDLKAFNRNNKLKGHSGDFDVPAGENMELDNFYPVQYELPETYKVGKDGLPMKEGNRRLVQALQLKGYLAVFEQLFLNFVSQLNSLNNIFSFNETTESYPAGKIIDKDNGTPPLLKENIAGYLHLYIDSEKYINSVQDITEHGTLFEKRRNKMLDHLLARFSENFEEYDSMMKYLYPKEYLKKILKNKTDFLADYPGISGNRGKAYNYKLEEEGYDDTNTNRDEELISKNISGLEQRIGRMIGLTDIKRKAIAPESLFFELNDKATPANSKGWIRLYDGYEKKNLLLETEEIEKKCEDEIMHCFIESACCGDNFILFPDAKHSVRRTKHHKGEYSFILIDDGKTIACSPPFNTKEERDKAFEKTKAIMKLVCDTEGLHIIEHILLRPRGDEEVENKIKPGFIKYKLLDVCLDKCDLNIGANASPLPVLYKFDISVLKGADCIDNKRWLVQFRKTNETIVIFEATFKEYEQASAFISRVREYGSELENFKVFKNDDDDTTNKYFFQLLDENRNIILESNYCYSDGGTDPVTKKKKFPDAKKRISCTGSIITTVNAWNQIQELKKFLAYELDLYCCEDACDNNEDPYSFRISFVLPCWTKRFRDKGFRRFVEKTIQSETPAHIHAKVYWLGVEQMRSYEDAWFEWLIETACNDVPDISLANDFITQVKQLKNCDEHCSHA